MIMESHFKEISIVDFRGFDYIEVGALNRLNVFIGANNVGKTSLLEALFMLSGMSNPMIANRVNYLRALNLSNMDSARYLFYNVDFLNRPVISGTVGDEVRRLTFSPVMQSDEMGVSSISVEHSVIRQLNFDFDIKKEGKESHYHTALVTRPDGNMLQVADENYKEKLNCLFVPVDKNDGNAMSNFSLLVKRNKKQDVIEVLRDFDSSIESVEALPDGLYLKKSGVVELLPISMAGDGVRRMVNVMSSIMNEDFNCVLIDEIDNGLHYSAHKLMWKTILKFVDEHNVQLFATTHNLDCLRGIKDAMSENEKYQAITNVYNIAKTKNEGFQTYIYAYSDLKEAIDNEIEIRR